MTPLAQRFIEPKPPSCLNLFQPGKNCWRTEAADYISIIVDYGNYYRDLHEAIVKAQHSIFILGWDIDSRIELLRGQAAKDAEAPNVFFDLICWKAQKNPDLQIYLNKWNYSVFFMREREFRWEAKWKACGLPNIHVCKDGMIPLGSCHHQKIAVIDDETVFWGGMDVALGRWDFRHHHVKNRKRADPWGFPHSETLRHFSPYHDIQAVMAGPSAQAMIELVRDRWRAASDIEPLPQRPYQGNSLPATWPDSDPPDFHDVDVAIARTIPPMQGEAEKEEILQLYLDEIAQAHKFIYIENQFLACEVIAKAINKRLHDCPELRVLAVSCWDPQGVMEKKAMWTGRVKFRDLIEAGGVVDRVALCYPTCTENDKTAVVRIHSKLMIIDDCWMHLGSSNINDRSMGMDTECDVTIAASNPAARLKIAAVRTDLIREHCGCEAEDIEGIIQNGQPVSDFLKAYPGSTQNLNRINDEIYRHERFAGFAKKLADPRRPLLSSKWTVPFHHGRARRQVWQTAAIFAALLLLIGIFSYVWQHSSLSQYASVEYISKIFEQQEGTPLSYIWIIGIYTLCSLLFIPVTILTAAVIVVYGGMKGLIISLVAAVLSGVLGYKIGTFAGVDRLKKLSRHTDYALNKISHTNVIGVAVIRTLPIAPFSVVNLVFGVSAVPLLTFTLGTIVGLLPGKIALALFGDSLADVVKHPNSENMAYALIGFSVWMAVMFGCSWLAKRWQEKHSAKQA